MNANSRNIAVFIDGTWNQADFKKFTNVYKLFSSVQEGVVNGRPQLKLYIPGVGCKPRAKIAGMADADYNKSLERILNRETLLSTMGLRKALGGFFGKGTTERIKAAYHFICHNFDKKRQDQIYLFGFSRGAFAARSVAGFFEHVGLLLAKDLKHIDRAYQLYETSQNAQQSELGDLLEQITGHRTAGRDGRFSLPIHFLGVWDTVASLGLPSRENWFSAPYTEYQQVEVPPTVMHARHALALHELRAMFEPLLWKPGEHPDLRQVWFPGAHSDVGGGYIPQESLYSDIALHWMANEAYEKGLGVDMKLFKSTTGSPEFGIHHEIRGPFSMCTPRARIWLNDQIQTKEAQAVLSTFQFHESAVEYLKTANKISYEFSKDCINSTLHNIDTSALRRFVQLRLLGQDTAVTREKPKDSYASHQVVEHRSVRMNLSTPQNEHKTEFEKFSGSVSGSPANNLQGNSNDWWQSISHDEWKNSSNVVNSFLQKQEAANESERECFARAAALQYFLEGEPTFMAVISRAEDKFPHFENEPLTIDTYRQASAWSPLGKVIYQGLNRCLELLKPCPSDDAIIRVHQFQTRLASLDNYIIKFTLKYGIPVPRKVRLKL